MKSFIFASALLVASASANQSAWGQCGGKNWNGAKTCVEGYVCQASNSYYSQCVAGTAPVSIRSPSVEALAEGLPSVNAGELPAGTLVTGCTVSGTVAVTFDDGPYQWTSALIDSLDAAGVKATFFMCGKLYGCIYDYADVVKKAFNSGHQVASHTWDHKDLTGLSTADINSEMSRVETAFKKILGIKPKWMRPPYGGQNSNVLAAMKTLGYKVVTWNLDSGDWNGYSLSRSQNMFTSLGADPKIIPLEHDALQSTAQQLGPWLITWAKGKNLKMVTLSECLGEPIPESQYTVIGGNTTKDSTWVC